MGSTRVGSLGKLMITQALNSGNNARGTVIMLHGSCDNGLGMKSWVDGIFHRHFGFSEYKVIYPTAPLQPYSLMNGEMGNIWFDRLSIGPDMPEDLKSINSTAKALSDLIKMESKDKGKNVVIGGFSMGGAMALHMAYRFHPDLIAGAFAMSSFLPPDSQVFNHLKEKNRSFTRPNTRENSKMEMTTNNSHSQTPVLDQINRGIDLEESINPATQHPKYPRLFMSQGTKDPLVQFSWSKETFNKLRNYGIDGQFFTKAKGEHEIQKSQLIVLHDWIETVLSDSKYSGPKSTNKKPPKTGSKKPYHINDEISIPAYDW